MRIISLAWGRHTSKSLYEENLWLREVLEEHEATIRVLRMALEKADLQHALSIRNLTAHFLEALDEDDVEALRDGIEDGLSDLNDHVARLQEHAD